MGPNKPGSDDLEGWIRESIGHDENLREDRELKSILQPPVPMSIHYPSPLVYVEPAPLELYSPSPAIPPSTSEQISISLTEDTNEELAAYIQELSVHLKSRKQIQTSTKKDRSWSPKDNRFACLPIFEYSCNDNSAPSPKPPASPKVASLPTKRPNWEKRIPRRYVLDTTSISKRNHLAIPVSIETVDSGIQKSLNALLDCGATGEFIDRDYVRQHGLTTCPLSQPVPVYNVDGTPNQAGRISEVVELILKYRDHTERCQFAVTTLSGHNLILGHSWLKEHNPEVDWQKGEVVMSRCPARCATCRSKIKAEKRHGKQALRTVRMGPWPAFAEEIDLTPSLDRVEEIEDEDDHPPSNPSSDPDCIEEGDRVFFTTIHNLSSPLFVNATTTVSQRLEEAFRKNSKPEPSQLNLPDWLKDMEDVFSKTSFDTLPDCKPWDHAIELVPGATSATCKVYPMSLPEQAALDVFLEENLRTGRIRPSKSPMGAPVFFVKKKDGSLRLVQDYRKLNAMTIKNEYPLPLISELIHSLRGARYFTKLDVRWGFNNVRIKEGDEWKAAFRTNRGLFEPLVMFFGLTNSPSTFQTMMNDIFHDLILDGKLVVYMDDILVYSKTREENRRITRLVLDRLRRHKLYLNLPKCEFEQEKIEYLGLIVSHNQVEMSPTKVEGVSKWPKPETVKDVQSFLGFTNFYHRFIEHYAHIARPLHNLTSKSSVFKWEDEEKKAFQTLKDLITSSPILINPTDDEPFRIEADSSDFATGAVLSQLSKEDGKWHPVAFLSKSLNAVERNYDIHDKEMLAIIRALEEWQHFLEGAKHKVEIWTDHKNLEYFMSVKKLNHCQARWSLFLSCFDFTLHHRPGRTMGKSDALSR